MKKTMLSWLRAIKYSLAGPLAYPIILCVAAFVSLSSHNYWRFHVGLTTIYLVTVIIIIAVAGAHYLMIKTRHWDNLVSLIYPTLFFSVWLICFSQSLMSFVWVVILCLIVRRDIKKEKKRMTQEINELIFENDYKAKGYEA